MNTAMVRCWRAFAAALAVWAWTAAWAADYTDTTATYSVYSLSDQTDTWTRCTLTVNNLYLASNANSRAELRLVASTNTINGAHYIGYAGPGTYRAESGSLLRSGGWGMDVHVGYPTNNGALYMTDSTGTVASSRSFTFRLGFGNNAVPNTYTPSNIGDMYLVRSTLRKESGGYLHIQGGGGRGAGRLYAEDSVLIATSITCPWGSGYSDRFASGYFVFDNSTVNLDSCILGGQPGWGPARGSMVLTNNSVAAISGTLDLGYAARGYYECRLTVDNSRLSMGGNVYVARAGSWESPYIPHGRLVLANGAVGECVANMVVGQDNVNRGHVDVLSGSRLSITNAAGTATLTVGQGGYGWLTVAGGTCRVDQLLATNLYSTVALSNGQLSVKSGTIANRGATIIGDGANPATLDLWGRQPFNVTSNLVFANHATLAVEIAGPTPGDYNYLDVHGTLTFQPGAALAVNLVNGYQPGSGDYITIAIADALTTPPDAIPAGYRAYIMDEGARKALKINLPPASTVVTIR